MLSKLPTGRRLAFSFVLCLAIALTVAVLLEGLAPRWPMRQLEIAGLIVVGVAIVGVGFGLTVAKLADYRDPEDEHAFDRLVEHAEELARENLAAEPDEGEFLELDPYDREDFEQLVREALDDMPDILVKALERVPVVISDKGRDVHAYGLYQ